MNKSDFEAMGIVLTDKQVEELCALNQTHDALYIASVMKILGALPDSCLPESERRGRRVGKPAFNY